MRNVITAVILMTFSMFASAQEQRFIYKQTRHGMIMLISESDTVKLTKYVPAKNGELERTVKMGGEQYLMSISTADPVKRLLGSDGQVLATVLMSRKNRYDIVMADGSVLDYTVNSKTWWYTLDGRLIMEGSLTRRNGQNEIVVANLDPDATSAAVWLACLERGSQKYASSSKTATLLVPAVGLSVVLALTSILDL